MKVYIGPDEVKGLGLHVVTGDIKDAATTPDKVLAPNVFYGNDGRQIGTMPNRGGMSAELAAGGSVSIPEGYHNGEGVVRAQDLASQTQGTAAAANIEAGYTAWVNGEMVEGTGKMDPWKVVQEFAVSSSSSLSTGLCSSPDNYLRITDAMGHVTILYIQGFFTTDIPLNVYKTSSSKLSVTVKSGTGVNQIAIGSGSARHNEYITKIEEVSLA